MTDIKTKTNPDEDLSIDEQISIDVLRRQGDRAFRERLDKDSHRINEVSKRLYRLETTIEYTRSTLDELKQRQIDWLTTHEQVAGSIADIASRLTGHTEMEEVQWDVVNKSNARVEQLSTALSHHLEASGALNMRIDWIERVQIAMAGAAFSLAVMLGGWAFTKLGW